MEAPHTPHTPHEWVLKDYCKSTFDIYNTLKRANPDIFQTLPIIDVMHTIDGIRGEIFNRVLQAEVRLQSRPKGPGRRRRWKTVEHSPRLIKPLFLASIEAMGISRAEVLDEFRRMLHGRDN